MILASRIPTTELITLSIKSIKDLINKKVSSIYSYDKRYQFFSSLRSEKEYDIFSRTAKISNKTIGKA